MHVASQLAEGLGLSSSTLTSSSQARNEAFLLEVLPKAMKSLPNLQSVYPFLQANLDKLDDNFAPWLQNWATTTFSNATHDQARQISATIGVFSNLILDFPFGSKANNIEIAIVGYEVILQIQTREMLPGAWAQTQHNLAAAYVYRIRGDRAKNIEHAIFCGEKALEVRSQEARPQQWASTQLHLAIAYRNRVLGNPTENLKLALSFCEKALQVHTRETYPKEWARIQHNLANVYYSYSQFIDNKTENIEKAIVCYHNALQIRMPEDFPEQWARTQLNLGNIYRDRILGDLVQNLELAIDCYEKALPVCTLETYPQLRAIILYSLGSAYSDRLWTKHWENRNNLEKAVVYFEEALQVFTSQDLPELWVIIQMSIGKIYSDPVWGDLELALSCYENALQIYTKEDFPIEWAMLQNELVCTYLDACVYNYIESERLKNLEEGIKCGQNALQIFTLEKFPQKWAMVQNNLASIYANLVATNQENLQPAILHGENALQVCTRESDPRLYANIFLNMGIAYQLAKQFHKSYAAFESVIDTVEFLRGKITADQARQGLATKWIDVYEKMVEICIELGFTEPHYYTKAIEYVERNKARSLVELLGDHHLLPKGVSQELNNKLKSLQHEIAEEQRQFAMAMAKRSGTVIFDEDGQRQEGFYSTHAFDYTSLNELQKQLDDFIENEIKPIDHHFSLSQKIEAISFHQIKNLLNEDTALIEWYLTSEYLRIFIITYQCEYPIVEQTPVWNCLPPKTITDCALMAELGHFLTEYEQDKTLWQTKLSEYFQNFAKIINLDKIFNLLPENCKQLILIPHRFLHWLPIHALPLVDGKCLLDKFDSVRYAPSCQLLEQVQQQQRPNLSDFFAIQNPENNLSYADLEVGVIRSFFATDKVLEKQAATKVALTDNQDLSLAHCSHFSCHGTFKSESPLESALKLANGEQLTLVDIFGLTLNQCRLVTLSACETGLTDPTSISDEYVGLPSGFLYAGSTNVVSSLWKVNDISSTFLMIKFYQNLKENQSRVAKTLNDAQRWLRDATQQQLLDWINQLKLDEDKMKQIKEKLDWYNSDEKPFNSPYHWATFCSIGQ